MNTPPVNVADKLIPTGKPHVGLLKTTPTANAGAATGSVPSESNSLLAMIAKLLQDSSTGEKHAKKTGASSAAQTDAAVVPTVRADTDGSQLLAMSHLASVNNVLVVQGAVIPSGEGVAVAADGQGGQNGGSLKTAQQSIASGTATQAMAAGAVSVAANQAATASAADATTAAKPAGDAATHEGQAAAKPASVVETASTAAGAQALSSAAAAGVAAKPERAGVVTVQADANSQAIAAGAKAAISPLPADTAKSQHDDAQASSASQRAAQLVSAAGTAPVHAAPTKATTARTVPQAHSAKPAPAQATLGAVPAAQVVKEAAAQTIAPQMAPTTASQVGQAVVAAHVALSSAGGAAPLVNQITDAAVANASSLGQQIVIRLNPPSLGEVKLTLSASGQEVQGTIQVQNADTYNQLRGETDQLVSRLADNGIHLRRMDVVMSDPSPQLGQDQHQYRDASRGQEQQAFAQSQQQASGDREGRPSATSHDSGTYETDEPDATLSASAADARGAVASDRALNVWM